MALDVVHAIDDLGKGGFSLLNWCCVCKKAEESVYHQLARDLCNLLFSLFGGSWVMLAQCSSFLTVGIMGAM